MAGEEIDYEKKLKEAVENAQKRVIEECLLACKYKRSETARRLGINRLTLQKKIVDLKIDA